ncbi:MAG: methyltransferase domain-containing protein [Candidatus Thiodiazotropha lotti]|nr:methyltransferase domain-containing protein [Candidatus Thiodiazotropha lotti]MCG8002762.1 methyltransferase domain-containing protein [Candidatus Thiodiazotropha lotti]MCG8007108.1 methyltransferase domain-containing protein [Candidatus Thiodiazotropha lotti]MCW4186382.1 methyltransferase domain-containing protein [Candidatus Thiodiazotropha lotti]MCW4194689.1 methyltransferase domain-containing protein [Candidatus Thiodiazotropha lotti]
MTKTQQHIRDYYSPEDLFNKIKSALEESGRGLENLTLDDLQPVDEFHIRGQTATMELIKLSDFSADMHILDVGCGIGGSARRLADVVGCRVTGIDLSEHYIATADALSGLVGMEERVEFQASNALDLPFYDATFDGIWSIQMNMNIHDKVDWLREQYRVLKPGGRLVLYEVCGNVNTPPNFPVPWAQDSTMSDLALPEVFRDHIVEAGFNVEAWHDKTDLAREAFAQVPEPNDDHELPELGVHLLVGKDILHKAYNLRRNLEEKRVSLIEAVAIKPVQG